MGDVMEIICGPQAQFLLVVHNYYIHYAVFHFGYAVLGYPTLGMQSHCWYIRMSQTLAN